MEHREVYRNDRFNSIDLNRQWASYSFCILLFGGINYPDAEIFEILLGSRFTMEQHYLGLLIWAISKVNDRIYMDGEVQPLRPCGNGYQWSILYLFQG